DGFFQELIKVNDKPCLTKIRCTSMDVEGPLDLEIESPMDIELSEVKSIIYNIFDLNTDLSRLYKFLKSDPCLEPTIDYCKGLRLFKAHDQFECLISSITSANNSIIRWNRSIRLMKEKWGEKCTFSTGNYHTFPCPDKLLRVPEKDLEEMELCGGDKDLQDCVNNLIACGVGYRSRYIRQAAQMVKNEMTLDEFFRMDYEEAFQKLLEIPGVGPKVADCILLYGFGRLEAFPVDVWIKRIISRLYFDGKDVSVPKIRSFGMDKFGAYAGYVQLYLFHYARKSGLMKSLK
ncbi:MAG TPA: DNA glycosylase, partial [Methanobacterium sp.]|nr:DNA glycosylase [Methanobacterium sp.]